MMKYFVFGLMIVVALFGLFLVKDGITGMAVSESTTRAICEFDSDCERNEVCCLFYNESAGVCHNEKACPAITELTKKESEGETAVVSLSDAETRIKRDYTFQIIAGLIFAAAAGMLFYVHAKGLKEGKGRKERKVGRMSGKHSRN